MHAAGSMLNPTAGLMTGLVAGSTAAGLIPGLIAAQTAA
jgi:hypothetical protein